MWKLWQWKDGILGINGFRCTDIELDQKGWAHWNTVLWTDDIRILNGIGRYLTIMVKT